MIKGYLYQENSSGAIKLASQLTRAARDYPCIKCGKEGETRAAHYNGPRQHVFGKGRGVKCSDIVVAYFCQSCDAEFTEGSTSERWPNRWERSEEFEYYCLLTMIQLYNDGVIAA